MNTVFIVRAARDIDVAPPWNYSVRIKKGELLLARMVAGARRAGIDPSLRLFPFPGIERNWHPFVNGRKDGLGVREDAVHILLPLVPPPPITARKDLSPSSWAAANHHAAFWFLERHEALTALLAGVAEVAKFHDEENEDAG